MKNISEPQHIKPIKKGAVAPPPEKFANVKILLSKLLRRKK